ncbi:JAB domain-containing protein [Mucilaginibacter rubeus]|uniref:JAB domain-containing protein n=1 Tax=Mucilaginibacter rubeus TaxID=2027860 RepID=A0A5C1I6J1_9SPHI|nr:JAB domain-containing protein [Mucilaginibacter rubeus]QEM13494.1 JAB domain-containing protein [Mucilaginibacter rubeus]
MKIWDDSLINLQEQVYVLFLNSRNEVISWRCVNTGSSKATTFDIKFTLSCALNCMATNIIIAHNHPSGELRPSITDYQATERLKMAAELLDIHLLDHLIIKTKGFYSLMDNKKASSI